MVIDTRTCIGCGDCVVACKTENKVPVGLNRDWVVELTRGTYPDLTTEFRSERCNHCSPCHLRVFLSDRRQPLLATTPTSCWWIAAKCTGCKACIAACPYDARLIMHPEGYIDKCTFCHHRVERGLDPACVSTCPTRCMHFGVLDDPQTAVARLLRTRNYKALLPKPAISPMSITCS